MDYGPSRGSLKYPSVSNERKLNNPTDSRRIIETHRTDRQAQYRSAARAGAGAVAGALASPGPGGC